MKAEDPIASPTLARLYLSQGHADRARAVLVEVLRRDPYDGVALELQRRLGAREPPALACELADGRVRLRWARVDSPARAHVVVVTFVGERTRVVSVRCDGRDGTWEVPVPAEAGSVAACIGCVCDGAWRVLAVAPPVRWG